VSHGNQKLKRFNKPKNASNLKNVRWRSVIYKADFALLCWGCIIAFIITLLVALTHFLHFSFITTLFYYFCRSFQTIFWFVLFLLTICGHSSFFNMDAHLIIDLLVKAATY